MLGGNGRQRHGRDKHARARHHGLVVQFEQIGNGQVLGAMAYAVVAGRAGDEALTAEDLLHPFDRGKLRLVERLKVAHESNVVLHLLQIAHAGEHHSNAREARRKADGVARGAAAVQGVQHGFCVVGQVDKAAALDRLHDDDGLPCFRQTS